MIMRQAFFIHPACEKLFFTIGESQAVIKIPPLKGVRGMFQSDEFPEINSNIPLYPPSKGELEKAK
jgi:hypothetical protein